ncbi:serine protease [Shewanella sp. 10N.286.52.B9]|uniref:trypsin-like serine peptidase n=1 Tax=Shewanella sp. 10N.286.52.B9 TaxID=1880837 RepID=UPI000C81F9F6|nr:serine protease [Shewanella sp. 10N.286.52.B9]PMG43402.1 hypothetical protein BCU91_00455 [Shewanella sp. 10N.286.52.B9]
MKDVFSLKKTLGKRFFKRELLGALVSINAVIFSGCLQSEEMFTAPAVDERPALPLPPGVDLESVCGMVDDLQHVEKYDGSLGVTQNYVGTHEKSTVQFQWKERADIRTVLGGDGDAGNISNERWCSGTLFQSTDESGLVQDYVLTAAHCFESKSRGWFTPTIDGAALSPEANAKLMWVNLNYQLNPEAGTLRIPAQFSIDSLVEYGFNNGGLDYAVVKLGGFAKGDSNYRKFYAQIVPRELQRGESLTIIQHPQGDPKKIESGSLQGVIGNDAFYGNIDTHGGSSGSGVRNKDGVIVAVHTHGGCSVGGGANKGLTLQAIGSASNIF